MDCEQYRRYFPFCYHPLDLYQTHATRIRGHDDSSDAIYEGNSPSSRLQAG
jgi:hypothetical protein